MRRPEGAIADCKSSSPLAWIAALGFDKPDKIT